MRPAGWRVDADDFRPNFIEDDHANVVHREATVTGHNPTILVESHQVQTFAGLCDVNPGGDHDQRKAWSAGGIAIVAGINRQS
jgi:hypothetical protein